MSERVCRAGHVCFFLQFAQQQNPPAKNYLFMLAQQTLHTYYTVGLRATARRNVKRGHIIYQQARYQLSLVVALLTNIFKF